MDSKIGLKSVVISLSLFSAIWLSGCKQKSKQESSTAGNAITLKPVKNDRLVLALNANPSILNPLLATDAYSREVTDFIFDRLISYDPETGEPQGRLAESWSVSKDGLTYSFKLRKNALWHDGKPVTVEDVKFTFDRIKDPKVDAAHLQNYYSALESVAVKGPFEIDFKVKDVYFRHLIMLGLAEILPKHIFENTDFNKNPANRAPIGSGPYQFVKWDSGRSVELKRFAKYWGNEDPKWKDKFNFNEILFRIITDESVSVMAMKKGDIDSIDPTPTIFMNDFADPSYEQKFYKLKYSTSDGNGFRWFGWNLRLPKFQSKKVRQALSMALPREEINKKVMKGLMTLSVGEFPQGSEKMDPSIKPIPYDLEKAKTLLAEEGWKDTDGDQVLDKNGEKFAFELLFAAGNPESERLALIYQQALKSIGIEMNIKTLEWTVFLKQVQDNKFDSTYMGWGAAFDEDPYQLWHSSQAVKGGSNRVGFSNKRVDEILTEARKVLDRQKRNLLYQEFSRILADEQPYTFVFERPHLAIIDRRFEGVLPVKKLGLDSSVWYTPLGREKTRMTATP